MPNGGNGTDPSCIIKSGFKTLAIKNTRTNYMDQDRDGLKTNSKGVSKC